MKLEYNIEASGNETQIHKSDTTWVPKHLNSKATWIMINIVMIMIMIITTTTIIIVIIQPCHYECDGISNHQPHSCLLNHLFRHRSKRTSKLRVTGLCDVNSLMMMMMMMMMMIKHCKKIHYSSYCKINDYHKSWFSWLSKVSGVS